MQTIDGSVLLNLLLVVVGIVVVVAGRIAHGRAAARIASLIAA